MDGRVEQGKKVDGRYCKDVPEIIVAKDGNHRVVI